MKQRGIQKRMRRKKRKNDQWHEPVQESRVMSLCCRQRNSDPGERWRTREVPVSLGENLALFSILPF